MKKGVLLLLAGILPAQMTMAQMITTSQYLEINTFQEKRQEVHQFFSRADVKEQLVQMGVNPEEAHLRIASMTDLEVMKLHSDIESAPAGQNAVLGVLLTVFIVLLITDLAGWTHVFPFTKKGALKE